MPGEDLAFSHRHFSHVFPIFPLGVLLPNNPKDRSLMERSLDRIRKFGFVDYASRSFPYLAILAARCGRGTMSRLLLDIYCSCFRSRNSFTVNGDAFNSGVIELQELNAGQPLDFFTLEAGLIVPAAVAEMLVHRVADTIFVLPAIPDDWKWCNGTSLALEGAHKVDLQMENYQLTFLRIRPGKDETVTLQCDKAAGIYKVGNEKESKIVNLKEGNIINLIKGIEIVMKIAPA
jgi:hypothetical protein